MVTRKVGKTEKGGRVACNGKGGCDNLERKERGGDAGLEKRDRGD